ncbi:MAG TPA: MlaD family protein [Solirubrobacteraceae bacterium]|jgi:virulence factor Mce-like protein|nr:MlaD family protein [Solirubrobacteraceae bacterium]
MQKGAPSFGKIATMVLFALSCFGLLLFLWLSFGGGIPFAPQGYRIKASFPYAQELAAQADVRIAGVSVGKVVSVGLDPQGNRTLATIQLDNQFAPLHADASAILREKTIIGETYVQINPGPNSARAIRDGGMLARTNVVPAVQLDQIFNAFDPTTRRAFQVWQQSLAQGLSGNGQNLNSVLGNLPTFAADGATLLTTLNIEHDAVRRLFSRGGTVFGALSQDQTALRNLITSAQRTFATTAANDNALAKSFAVLPIFLNETKLTMTRLQSFATNTDPVLKELMPVAADLGPTLRSVRTLSPDLRSLFVNLNPLITASKTGLPALAQVLDGASPLLSSLGPFLEQVNPILTWLSLHQQLISDFFSIGGGALAGKTTSFSGGTGHYLPQYTGLGAQSLAIYPSRLPTNRGNTYPPPLWAQGTGPGQHGILPSWDCNNTGAPGDGSIPPGGTNFPCWVAPPLGNLIGEPTKSAQVQPATYSSK